MKKIYVLWQWLFVKNLKSVHIIHLGRPKMVNLMRIILLSHHIFRIFLSLVISNDIALRKNHIIIVSRYLLPRSSRKNIDSKKYSFSTITQISHEQHWTYYQNLETWIWCFLPPKLQEIITEVAYSRIDSNVDEQTFTGAKFFYFYILFHTIKL